jgi:hypothetical protein
MDETIYSFELEEKAHQARVFGRTAKHAERRQNPMRPSRRAFPLRRSLNENSRFSKDLPTQSLQLHSMRIGSKNQIKFATEERFKVGLLALGRHQIKTYENTWENE